MTTTVTGLVTRHTNIKPKGIKHQQSPSVRMKREGKHWVVWREIESFSCGQPLMHPQAKIKRKRADEKKFRTMEEAEQYLKSLFEV
ncbi:Uncharacterised protein [Neisseria subflava]|uniref:Uncharacterized protein n=1 Tax=Neisseria subflava TaxID=28449 RepID=A0A9X9QZV8_NEISU|nr:hypothetical protein [Neisseria subflava]VTY10051.1 Uncharacterised protein [Neisseria subflava]